MIILLLVLVFVYMMKFVVADPKEEDPGFQVVDIFNESELNYILGLVKGKQYMDVKRFIHNHPELLKHIQHVYGIDYVFMDYIFSIEKSSVSTCHRDENGSIINPKVTHPSFTVIFYLEDMEACLDVIPKSHRDRHSIYLSRPLKSVPCTPGQAIFFDANLIHAGSINVKDDNKRIQMKIVHKDDLEHMGEFNHYYRVGDVSKDISKQRTLFHRRVSCTFPGVADLTKNGNVLPEFMGDMYKKVVYGDKDNYKLTVIQK